MCSSSGVRKCIFAFFYYDAFDQTCASWQTFSSAVMTGTLDLDHIFNGGEPYNNMMLNKLFNDSCLKIFFGAKVAVKCWDFLHNDSAGDKNDFWGG